MIHAYVTQGGAQQVILFCQGERLEDESNAFAQIVTGDMDAPNGQPTADFLAGNIVFHDERV
jgi:hypothetical protein